MGGFWGAEVEALRRQGEACGTAAGSVEALLGSCAGLIDGVEWIGPDADSFRERWGSDVRPLIEQIIAMLRADEHELDRNADAQDEVSSEGDGGGGSTLPGVPIPSLPLPLPLPEDLPPILPPIGPPFPIPDAPFDLESFPFPHPTIPRFELPRCPVVKPEPEIFEVGTFPTLTLPRPPVCPSFPPPMTDCWPQPQPLPLPEPMPIPENWPLPQPLPQPLPIPDQWPLPLPLPRPDVYRL